MKGSMKIILAVVLIAVVLGGLWFVAGGLGPSSAGSVTQPTPSGQGSAAVAPGCSANATGDPTIVAQLSDAKTNKVNNEGTVVLYTSTGTFVQTQTTSSGKATFSGIAGGQSYQIEAYPVTGTTAFYAKNSGVFTACGTGPTSVPIQFLSETTTAPTLSVTNDDASNTANASGARQAINANQTVTFKLRVKGTTGTSDYNVFGDGVGAPVFRIDANNQIQSIQMLDISGTPLSSAGAISGSSAYDTNKTNSFYFAANQKTFLPDTPYDFLVKVTGSAVDPTSGGGSYAEIGVTLYDAVRVKRTISSTFDEYYVNPNDNSALGSSNGTVGIFTS